MPNVPMTEALADDYRALFETCVVAPAHARMVDVLVDKLESNRGRYEDVASDLGIPWGFIAVIHNMESSQRFDRHLHNGDPLTARTRQVPAGRPRTAKPPFTWEQSADDALTMKGLGSATDWALPALLYQLERYNGWGYRLYHPHVRSPYLWSYSNHYTSGKYVADGRWSDTAVSQQCGAAVLLRRMVERKFFAFPDQPFPDEIGEPLVIHYHATKFADRLLTQEATNLQVWLNTYSGIFVRPDGVPGVRTSDAYKTVTGQYLPGDPRL